MASGDYSYPNSSLTFSARDGLAGSNPDKIVKGVYHEAEFLALRDAIDVQINTNTPVMAGTLNTGTIDGGTW